jgi:glycosyltransferase involved in cell wall biosynthesis
MTAAPEVSVIVPVRQAEATIVRTLTALSAQCEGCNAEVIAVVSESDPTSRLLNDFHAPHVRVLVQPGGGVPQLRRDGVAASRGKWLVITEDHCTFPEGWLGRLVEVQQARGGVVGGPVGNGNRTFTGWAQYFTRYSAFLPPGLRGAARALPGNNAIYARTVVQSHLPHLKEGFWEAEFNHALARDGVSFWAEPELAVEQHQRRGLLTYLPLRYRHGRCYGWRRSRDSAPGMRWRLIAAVPLVPLLLYLRAARNVFAGRGYAGRFLIVTPLLMAYFAAWATGEAAGYLFGPSPDWWDTD